MLLTNQRLVHEFLDCGNKSYLLKVKYVDLFPHKKVGIFGRWFSVKRL
jgi:hypothetical protein